MSYQELLDAVLKLRNSPQIEDRADVPVTLPVGGAIGEEIYLPLEGRKIRALLHRPPAKQARHPVYFNFHGGGMVKGVAEMDEFICDQICKTLGCIVVNVEYRLAPEHPFPQGLDDCYDTIVHMVRHAEEYAIDADRMAVGGQSAGGNLAAATAILANRRREFSLSGQIMVYAAMRMGDPASGPSGDGISTEVIPKSTSRLYRDSYGFGGADLSDPLASPINASEAELSGLPSALIITAELDSLAPEAEQYALKLARVGTFVE
ncbi:MAG TPA: alpha/beta hydrolase, partial [Spirochaetia bacterium]|nr:alpha/beta hydrolase [Spirochaetia bacterium]